MIIRIEPDPKRTVVVLGGRFDAHEADEFSRTVRPLLQQADAVIRLDLSAVTFVDSTALTELLRLQKAARYLSGELILVHLSDPVRVILEITDLLRMFAVEPAPVTLS